MILSVFLSFSRVFSLSCAVVPSSPPCALSPLVTVLHWQSVDSKLALVPGLFGSQKRVARCTGVSRQMCKLSVVPRCRYNCALYTCVTHAVVKSRCQQHNTRTCTCFSFPELQTVVETKFASVWSRYISSASHPPVNPQSFGNRARVVCFSSFRKQHSLQNEQNSKNNDEKNERDDL